MGAIVEAFYGAQACGDAIADLLFGKVAPSGKMPVSAYASPEQAGNITSMDMSRGLGRTYRYLQGQPTYEFGFGLSYTTWSFLGLAANVTVVPEAEAVAVSVTVANTGAVSSAQVVQLYASLAPDFTSNPLNVSKHVPPRQLVAFEKVYVPAAGHVPVTMTFTPSQLSGWELWFHPNATLHLFAGDVSPTPKAMASRDVESQLLS